MPLAILGWRWFRGRCSYFSILPDKAPRERHLLSLAFVPAGRDHNDESRPIQERVEEHVPRSVHERPRRICARAVHVHRVRHHHGPSNARGPLVYFCFYVVTLRFYTHSARCVCSLFALIMFAREINYPHVFFVCLHHVFRLRITTRILNL